MNKFAIVAAGKPARTGGCLAIISGALLVAVTATQPAQSADLYPYPYPYQHQYTPYQPAYVPYYRNYYQGGCHQCYCHQCGCCGVTRTYAPVAPVAVAERHWVQRDYWERRYPADSPHYYSGGYPYYPYSGRYQNYSDAYPNYSDGYQNYSDGYSNYPSSSGWEARPHLGFGGIQYRPSRVSYEDEASPSWYEYEGSPRPPTGIPSPYYNSGYPE